MYVGQMSVSKMSVTKMVLHQKMCNHRYGCKKVGEAIGIGSGSLVMLGLLASAND